VNNKKIIIKFPSRERPKKFRDCLANIIETISDLDNILILVTVDEDDESMRWVKNIDKPFVKVIFGKSESKIHAVNRDMNLIDFNWDYLVLMSDDMMFIKQHWDKEIISKFKDIKSPLIIHYPTDLLHGQRIITMPIMNKKFYDYFGYIYEPSYKSLFCDDEQTFVSKKLNFYKKYEFSIAVHLHPIYTNEQFDRLLTVNQEENNNDFKNFEYRKIINFGLYEKKTDRV